MIARRHRTRPRPTRASSDSRAAYSCRRFWRSSRGRYAGVARRYRRSAADSRPLPRERQRRTSGPRRFDGGPGSRARRTPRSRARVFFESQKLLYNPDSPFEKGWHAALGGEIALAEKRLPEAAAAFTAGEPPARVWISLYLEYPWALMNGIPARDGMARVATARGDRAGAIAIYRQRLLVPGPAQKWTGLFDPRYVLEIARLLDQSGDPKAALVEYQRFLEVWQNADPDLPELSEARRAVARLRGN